MLPAATGTASPIPDGTRITFGASSADLNPSTYAALVAIAAQANQDKLIEITLSAWAPGSNDDPSTPRRLSLDRALAGRAVLIHAGVASERIHAVAKGFIDIGADTPDRMDIIAAHPRATPAPKPPAPTKAAPK